MARRIGAAAYHNPENIQIMGMSLSPVQLGLGALALGGVGYLVYTNYIAAPAEEAPLEGIQQISLTTGQEATAETVSEEEVATPVVMPELTKAEWLKKIKETKAFTEIVKELSRVSGAKPTAKIEKVAVVKKDTTFFAQVPRKPYESLMAMANVDQILTLGLKVGQNGSARTLKVYWLAKADQTVKCLGNALITPTSSVKITGSTQLIPIGISAVASKEELAPEALAELQTTVQQAVAKVAALKALKAKVKRMPKALSAYVLSGETILGIDVKAKKGSSHMVTKGAKLFQAGDRIVKLSWPNLKSLPSWERSVAGAEYVVIAAADGKITPVRLEQPVTMKGLSLPGGPPRPPTAAVSRVTETTEMSTKPKIAMRNRLHHLGDMSDVIPVKDEEHAEEHYTMGQWLSLAVVAALGLSAHAYMMRRGLY